jgi:TetR/AcrR family transcriptional repressor of mexJK operon
MIAEKSRAILSAAHQHFLRDGFAAASMDAIANSAGVSVKTIYSHFANKAELFSNVMAAACTDHSLSSERTAEAPLAERFTWFSKATQNGLAEAGKDYLNHVLSAQELALYRVLTRDAARFPELGHEYHKNFVQGRTELFVAYMRNIAEAKSLKNRDSKQDATVFEALLRAGIYEDVLHGLTIPDSDVIDRRARLAAKTMWKFLAIDAD